MPSEPAEGWELLGYDVSDDWLLSGLTNCGYRQEELEPTRQKWSSRLNRHHLFDAITDAAAFRQVTNERVPEHAPFNVFSVYRVL